MPETTISVPEFLQLKPQYAAVVRGENVPVEDMVKFLDSAFTVLRGAADAALIAPNGPIYSRYDTELEGDVRIEAGIPLIAPLDQPVEFSQVWIEPGELPGGRIVRAEHIGPYSELAASWQRYLADLEKAGHVPQKPYWETYWITPGPATDPSQLRTELSVYLGDE